MPLLIAPPFLAHRSTANTRLTYVGKNTPTPNEPDADDTLAAYPVSGDFHEEKQPLFPTALDSIPLRSRIVIRAWHETPLPPRWVDLAYTNDADVALKIGAVLHRRFGEKIEVRLVDFPFTLLGSWP